MNIGIAGTGRMGSAIAQRLIDRGHAVTAWNRTPDKAKAVQAAGATLAASASALVQRCELILTILTDARAIHAVYRAPGGLTPLAARTSSRIAPPKLRRRSRAKIPVQPLSTWRRCARICAR